MVCGIDSQAAIPHKSTFSRFFAKMARDSTNLRVVKDVSRRLVRHHYATIPGFGERTASFTCTPSIRPFKAAMAWAGSSTP